MPARCLHYPLVAAAALLCAACGGDTTAPAAVEAPAVHTHPELNAAELNAALSVDCPDAGDEAFVRRAVLHLWGRRPHSAREVALLVQAVAQSDRATVARAMTHGAEYVARWRPFLLDLLYVNRYGERANTDCSGESASAIDGGEAARPLGPDLAAHVRDNPPDGPAFEGLWNLYDLVGSALLLDDLSPVYRAQLFAQSGSRLFDAEQPMHELAWRRTYSQIFERNYLNRRMECLPCHNSAHSVTGHPDPALDRTWEAPGLIERALYGADAGMAATRLDAFFRLNDVFSMVFVPEGLPDQPDKYWDRGPGIAPWGILGTCGQFVPPAEIPPDDLGGDGFLVEAVGPRASIWDLERIVARGFSELRANPTVDADLTGHRALAWAIALTLADRVWTELTGSPLTAPHGLPRTQAQRDQLVLLATTFVEGGFSLRDLVVAAVTSPWFNLASPAACDGSPYHAPPLFNPWVLDDEDEERRSNSLGDAVVRVPPRLLASAAQSALDWVTQETAEDLEGPPPEDMEALAEAFVGFTDRWAAFEIDIGTFALDGEPGFRGSSFREALAWEAMVGACRDPIPPEIFGDRPDWIARLADAAAGATLQDAVATLKDRLLADPDLSDPTEQALLAQLLGHPLDTPLAALPDPDATLRRACAGLLSSPQFVLDGLVWPESAGREPPVTVPGQSREALCEALATDGLKTLGPRCESGHLRL